MAAFWTMARVGRPAPAGTRIVSLTVGGSLVLSILVTLVWRLQHGTASEGAPTQIVVARILLMLRVTTMRQEHGLHTIFDLPRRSGAN